MAASLGGKVAVAEERALGGTCVNVGCVPKKLFVYGSRFAEDFEDSTKYGYTVPNKTFDWAVLRDAKTTEVQRLNKIYRTLLDQSKVEVFSGTTTLENSHTVRVNDRKITSKFILIATGSWPYVPPIPGREHVITSNEMFYLDQLPQHITIVGGGYIAVEFAGITRGLGVDTTLVYRGPLFLRNFDQDIRRCVAEEVEKKNIELVFRDDVKEIRSLGSNFTVHLQSGRQIPTEQVLYATGRQPLTNNLGLNRVGVEVGPDGAVQVSDQFRTSVSNIYAVGDVINRAQLTPVAIKEGATFARNVFNGENNRVNYSIIPTCVFCQPNIGTVGPTEDEARSLYSNIQIFETSFTPMKHTVSGRAEKTYIKLIVNEENDRLIAAHMVGPDAGEIIQGFAVAISAKATKRHLDETIGIHPTTAEEFVTMTSASRR